MPMPVVQVGPMGMGMAQRFMSMRMGVRRIGWCFIHMCMLVMCVMAVPVAVFQRLVRMGVQVIFGQAEPDADAHQCARDQELRRHRI